MVISAWAMRPCKPSLFDLSSDHVPPKFAGAPACAASINRQITLLIAKNLFMQFSLIIDVGNISGSHSSLAGNKPSENPPPAETPAAHRRLLKTGGRKQLMPKLR